MAYLHIKLEEILKEKNLSKKKVCSALDIERTNFNRYYNDEFQRIDANLILKLCRYFECEVGDLFEIREGEKKKREKTKKAGADSGNQGVR